MMELVHFGMINWYLASREDIDVRGATAILGKNTSGKSSLLDMAQVVLTGHNKHFIRLNASAGDGKHKKSARSIRDYCLGAYGGGKTIRSKGKTILFLGFQDPDGERQLTIGVALEADENSPSERLLDRFIVPGAILSTKDFIEEIPGGQRHRVKDWPSCKAALERAAKSGAVSFDTSSEGYIKNWTKLASTGKRSLSPARLMKAIVNAISFEEIASATQFVRDFVLNPSPLEIAELKTSIKTYHDLHRKIRDLRLQLETADEITAKSKAYGHRLKQELDYNASAAVLAYTSSRSLYFVNVGGARRKHQEAADLAREISEIDEEIKSKKEELSGVESLIQASHQNSQRVVVEAQKRAAQSERNNAEKDLQQLYLAVCDTVRKANAADKIEPLGPITAPLGNLASSIQDAIHPSWPKDVSAAVAAINLVSQLSPACKTRMDKVAGQITRQRTGVEEQIERTAEILDNIRTMGAAISRTTSDLVDALKNRGMRPRILCQLIDVSDESWRDAAEIMLGRDREAIIVEARHAIEAKDFVRANSRQFRGARIVGTDKEDWRSTDHKPDSLAAVIETEDADARILLDKRLGNIRRAESTTDLRRAGRAIMRDGTFDDGIVVELRHLEHGRKIGAKAANPAELELALNRLQTELRELAAKERALNAAAAALSGLSQIGSLKADAIILGYSTAEETLRRAIETLDKIDSQVDPKLAERKTFLENMLTEFAGDRDEAIAAKATAETEAKNFENKLEQGDLSAGSRLNVLRRRSEMGFHLPKAKRSDAFALARAAVGTKSSRRADHLHKASLASWTKASDAKAAAEAIRSQIFDLIVDFNQQWQSAPGFVRNHSSIAGEILPFFENLATQIRSNELVDHEQRARQAAIDTRGMFQTAFVASLSDKIKAVYSEVDRLNGILAQHRFHGERYRFKAIRAAEYEKLIDFVEKAVQDDSALLPLLDADQDQIDPNSPAGEINRILLDETFDISNFEDYRQYFTFDLMMHNEATKTEENLERRRGLGSGAERQMPFYVAIGAALSAAWHGGKESRASGGIGLGLAIFDEAFSKMDQPNQRACIQFFASLGLQTVIAAPAEKTPIALANMDTIVLVSREGTKVEFDSTYIKNRTREAIAAEDPSSLSVADVRALMAQRAAELEARRQEEPNPEIIEPATQPKGPRIAFDADTDTEGDDAEEAVA